jgi:hypothetical protein
LVQIGDGEDIRELGVRFGLSTNYPVRLVLYPQAVVALRVTYLAFTAIKWYTTMVHMAREPRVLARVYRVSWVIVAKRRRLFGVGEIA